MSFRRNGRAPRNRWVSSGTGFLAVLALAVIALGGCKTARQVAARYPRSDIEAIYADSQANAARNPVVLVHGFAGARLERIEDGATVWGAFFTDNSLLPSKQPGLRAFSLDIDSLGQPVESEELLSIADDSRAVELLQRVRADAGVADINVGIYAALVELMESSGYGDCQSDPSAIDTLAVPPCLAFFYDWRQDNVGNAIRLGRFLEKARAQISALQSSADVEIDKVIRFDLVAHSMGGLVSRYFLRYGTEDVLADPAARITWAGSEYVDRLILISTPNFGATRVLKEMVQGRRYPVIKFEPVMIATWVSAYQMLPRQEHRVWLDPEGGRAEEDFLSARTWREYGWGPFAPGQENYLRWLFPGEASPTKRQERLLEFMDAAFDRAGQFFQAMDRHADVECPTDLTLFAADVQPTFARVMLLDKGGRKTLRFENTRELTLKTPGDGSVTRASAVGDERLVTGDSGFLSTPIPWDRKIFLTDMHMTFLGNPTFQNNLLHILLETPPIR